MKLTVLLDGLEPVSEQELGDIIKPMPEAFLRAFHAEPQPYHFSYNVLYAETGGEHVLFDTGIGAAHKPQYGNLLDLLAQTGVSAGQIDKVIVSHFHLDHIGGLTAEAAAVFPNAMLVLPLGEKVHWLESGCAPAERTALIQQVFEPYADRIQYVSDGDTVAKGVTVVALPGHTPGHCGFMIESQGERLVHMVDTLHLHMQLPFPEVSPVYDLLPDLSPVTRRRLLDRAVDEDLLLLTYHLRFPGLGRVSRAGTGFQWNAV